MKQQFKIVPLNDDGEYDLMDGEIFVATVYGSARSDFYVRLLSEAPMLLDLVRECMLKIKSENQSSDRPSSYSFDLVARCKAASTWVEGGIT